MERALVSLAMRRFLAKTSPSARRLARDDHVQRSFTSASHGGSSIPRPDPFARRPNRQCDPYGQGGKPLMGPEAEKLLTTVHPEWTLLGDGNENGDIPTHLTRSFQHLDFMAGASFLTHVAAVAQMNDHFPTMQLERRLDSKRRQWVVESTVTCHTFVLQGLSHHDFFIATLIDIEVERPEVKRLLIARLPSRESD